MSGKNASKKKLNIVKMILFGIGSVVLYATLFANEETVQQIFSRGHWFAVLPILTVFVFSFVHGAFASYLWSVLGFDVPKKH